MSTRTDGTRTDGTRTDGTRTDGTRLRAERVQSALPNDARRHPIAGARLQSYRPGDERRIIRLFNDAYRNYGGYVVRNEERWRWSILRRPGMQPENVLLFVDARDALLAYGVLDGDGAVLEFAVIPSEPRRRRRKLAAALLAALEERGRALGLETIDADLPLADPDIRAAAEAAGYRMEPAESLQFVIVDLVALLRALLRRRSPLLERYEGRTFRLEVEPGRCRFVSHRHVTIRVSSGIEVEPGGDARGDEILIATDLTTLMGIVLQGHDPKEVVRAGGVRVAWRHGAAARALLGAITLDAPWYIPRADGR